MKTLSRENYKRIYDIACSTWKPKLQEWYGNKFAIEDEINIKDSQYKIMREACTSEQNDLFDEIFGKDKKALEVGKWYKNKKYDTLLCYTGGASGYGFIDGYWEKGKNWGTFNIEDNYVIYTVEATEEEVKMALLKEAEKRGIKEGVKVTQINTNNMGENNWVITENYTVHITNKGLYLGNICIFFNGKWAEIVKEKTYKIGQRFKKNKRYKYILAQTQPDKICLICLETGNRWNNPIKVNDSQKITAVEFKKIIGGNEKVKFTLYKE